MDPDLCPVRLHGISWLFLIPALFSVLLLIRPSLHLSRGSYPVTFKQITTRVPYRVFELLIAFVLAVLAFLLYQLQFDATWDRWASQLPVVKQIPFAEFEPGQTLDGETPLSLLVDRVRDAKHVKVSISPKATAVVVKGTYNGDCWADLLNDICDKNKDQLRCRFDAAEKTFFVCRSGDKEETCSPAQ